MIVHLKRALGLSKALSPLEIKVLRKDERFIYLFILIVDINSNVMST